MQSNGVESVNTVALTKPTKQPVVLFPDRGKKPSTLPRKFSPQSKKRTQVFRNNNMEIKSQEMADQHDATDLRSVVGTTSKCLFITSIMKYNILSLSNSSIYIFTSYSIIFYNVILKSMLCSALIGIQQSRVNSFKVSRFILDE